MRLVLMCVIAWMVLALTSFASGGVGPDGGVPSAPAPITAQ